MPLESFKDEWIMLLNTLNYFIVVYVDDILISSQTLEEHREHLKIFVKAAIKEGICLSEKKTIIE